ncbi:ECF transporter S component [Amnibacterium endophyticum]|uniref:ECF transporter S component n=1 Tax=Amnibacterium endophyticum TaxID=2109337 RepID=A0ABW4LKM5_9MICO
MTASTTVRNRTARSYRWRVVDIVVASVLGVACGFLFIAWNVGYQGPSNLLTPVLPGIQGLVNGVWFIAGPLVALVVRKPGAALYGELLAAVVSALVGNQWGATVLVSGLMQGIGAEILFAVLGYRVWTWWSALLAGALAGVGASVYDLSLIPGLAGYYAGSSPQFAVVYLIAQAVSGAVLAGLLAWVLVQALARTGVLARFPAGRARRAG